MFSNFKFLKVAPLVSFINAVTSSVVAVPILVKFLIFTFSIVPVTELNSDRFVKLDNVWPFPSSFPVNVEVITELFPVYPVKSKSVSNT